MPPELPYALLRRAGWTHLGDDCWRTPDDREADGSEALRWAERVRGAASSGCVTEADIDFGEGGS